MARILVIDDEELVQIALQETLTGEGHEVSVATDGVEGVRLYEKSPFDLVITDIIMPNKEGVETILELKLADPDLKIIAISGGGRNQNVDYLETAYKLGANKALTKPFSKQTLLECVNALLN